MANDVATQVLDQLENLGWTRAQATGIAANLQAESNFNPSAVGDGGKAYGVAQWHPDRQQEFTKLFGKPIQGSTLAEQVTFIDHELRNGNEQRAGQKLLATTTPGDAAAVISQHYERPKDVQGSITHRTNLANSLAGLPTTATQVTPKMSSTDQNTPAVAAAGAAAVQQNNAAAAALEAIGRQQQTLIDSTANLLEGGKADAVLIKQTEELGKAKAQQRTLDFATQIGANPDAANAALGKLIEQSNQLFDKQRAVAARLENAGNPRTMFDNPIRWLADYLLIPENKQRLDAVNTQLKTTTDQIKWINDTTQNYKQTMDAIAQTKTVATAEAAGRQIQSQIDLDVAKTRAEGLRLNAQNITDIGNLRNGGLNIQLKLRDQVLQEKQLEEAAQSRKLQQEALDIQLKDRKTEDAAKQKVFEAYNLGAQNTGTIQFKTKEEMYAYKALNKNFAQTFEINFANGFAQLNNQTPTIAATPSDALEFVVGQRPNLDPSRKILMDKIGMVYSDFSSNSKIKAEMDANPRAVPARINDKVRELTGTYAGDITAQPDRNFYAPPPLPTLLQDPELGKTYWGEKILAPLAAAGETQLPFTKAIDLLVADVKAGKLTVNQADFELDSWAKKIMLLNNDMYRYKATAGVDNMKTVNVPVRVRTEPGIGYILETALIPGAGLAGMPTTVKPIDLLDPVARSTMWNKRMAEDLKLIPAATKTN